MSNFDEPYDPILFKLARRGFATFCRVIHYFKNYNLDNEGVTLEFKNSCETFLVAEADCWELYDDTTTGILFQSVKSKMRQKKLTKGEVAQRFARVGYLTDAEIEKDRIATLILIRPLL